MASNSTKKCGMNLDKVFDDFVGILKSRQGIMTEDNVRYYWFDSMRNQVSDINCYTLEHPFPKEATQIVAPEQKRLDLLYNNWEMCFEMKFHHKAPSTFAHTDAAGSLFNDLQRLQALISVKGVGSRGFLLYVTDDVMDKYLSGDGNNYRKMLNTFYNMNPGQTETITFNAPNAGNNVPSTFWESSFASINKALKGKGPLQVKVKLLRSASPAPWHVRLYEVL